MKILSYLLAIFLLLSPPVPAASEPIEDENHLNLYKMVNAGYVKGYEDGNYAPDSVVTIAEFTALLMRVLNITDMTVYPDSWMGGYMDKANELGWFDRNEYPDPYGKMVESYFKRYIDDLYNTPIPRRIAARMIMRAIKEPASFDQSLYKTLIADSHKLAGKYIDYVFAAYAKGIFSCDANNYFNPEGTIRRTEACDIITRAILDTSQRAKVNIPVGTDRKAKKVLAGNSASYIIDENGGLWGFGNNRDGILGVGHFSGYEVFPLRILGDVKTVFQHSNSTIAIKNNHELWGWGRNIYGPLGASSYQLILKPIKLAEQIKTAAVYDSGLLFINNNNELWASRQEQGNIELLAQNAKDVICGRESYYLDYNGAVFYLKFDLGQDVSITKICDGVQTLGKDINADIFVSMENGHIMKIAEDGEISKEEKASNQIISEQLENLLAEVGDVKEISSGLTNTLALTESGEVFYLKAEQNTGFSYTEKVSLGHTWEYVSYFPENMLSAFEVEWFTNQLNSSLEPSIYNHETDRTIYRFLYLGPSDHEQISIRIEVDNQNGKTYCKRGISDSFDMDQTAVDQFTVNEVFELTPDQTIEIVSLIENIGFWSILTADGRQGPDGSVWMIEGLQDGKYHFVNRWSPQDGEFRNLCVFFAKLGGLEERLEPAYND